MKKITLMLITVGISLFSASGQTTAQDAISKMKQETANMDNILAQIDVSIQKDKHKEMEPQIHNLETSLSVLQDQAVYLDKTYLEGLTAKTADMQASIKDFEKIVHKSSVFDKDKELNSAHATLETKLTSIKSYIDFVQNEIFKNQQEQQQQQQSQQTQQQKDNRQKSIPNLKTKVAELETQFKKASAAFAKSAFTDVGEHSEHIAKLCTALATLNENLNEDERSANAQLLITIKEKSESNETLSKTGAKSHDQIHKNLDAIKAALHKLKDNINALN
ncbi:hypothetical protein [Flavobacterium sp.]